jgi:serine/threonine-protein kinase
MRAGQWLHACKLSIILRRKVQVTPRTRAAMDEELTISEEPPVAPAATGSSPRLGMEPGTMLGEYRIGGLIGEGSMGRVFAAVHPVIGKRAAIKVLTREQCADPHAVSRFIDEARVVNQIGHPNIVDIFAFGELPDGRHYFAMELLDGETLGARIRRDPLTLGETCGVIRSLARALDAAHAKGIVHRDLKPDNVFLVAVRGEPPVVKLLDFGIAKLSFQDPAFERTAVGAMMGTPQYIAPEQARGVRIDGRADIYALGGILFELVTGRPVFFADNTPEVLMKHLTEPPPRPSQFARVPSELDELIVAMLAKEPEQRPSLDQVCEVIGRLRAKPGRHLQVAPLIGTATLSGAITAERPTVGRPRRVLLLIAITLAAAGIAFAIVQHVTRPRRDPAGERRTPSATTKPAAVAPPQVPIEPPQALPAPAPTPAPVEPSQALPAVEPPHAQPAVEPPQTPPAVASSPAEQRPQPRQAGRLELIIHGAAKYTVIVDGKPHGKRPLLVLPPGTHDIEVRVDGEAPQRFSIAIEAGRTKQHEVAWSRAAPQAAGSADDRALMAPGDAVPKAPR